MGGRQAAESSAVCSGTQAVLVLIYAVVNNRRPFDPTYRHATVAANTLAPTPCTSGPHPSGTAVIVCRLNALLVGLGVGRSRRVAGGARTKWVPTGP